MKQQTVSVPRETIIVPQYSAKTDKEVIKQKIREKGKLVSDKQIVRK